MDWCNKASLQKLAGLGKNYIDKLDSADDLAKRINSLLRGAKDVQAKRDVEQTLLQENRELKHQSVLHAKESQELMNQINRTRSELERARQTIASYERYYAAETRVKPVLTLVENDRSAQVIPLPQHEPTDD